MLDERFCWKVLHESMEGLSYIHRLGLVHRDLKPDNIFYVKKNMIDIGEYEGDKSESNSINSSTIGGNSDSVWRKWPLITKRELPEERGVPSTNPSQNTDTMAYKYSTNTNSTTQTSHDNTTPQTTTKVKASSSASSSTSSLSSSSSSLSKSPYPFSPLSTTNTTTNTRTTTIPSSSLSRALFQRSSLASLSLSKTPRKGRHANTLASVPSSTSASSSSSSSAASSPATSPAIIPLHSQMTIQPSSLHLLPESGSHPIYNNSNNNINTMNTMNTDTLGQLSLGPVRSNTSSNPLTSNNTINNISSNTSNSFTTVNSTPMTSTLIFPLKGIPSVPFNSSTSSTSVASSSLSSSSLSSLPFSTSSLRSLKRPRPSPPCTIRRQRLYPQSSEDDAYDDGYDDGVDAEDDDNDDDNDDEGCYSHQSSSKYRLLNTGTNSPHSGSETPTRSKSGKKSRRMKMPVGLSPFKNTFNSNINNNINSSDIPLDRPIIAASSLSSLRRKAPISPDRQVLINNINNNSNGDNSNSNSNNTTTNTLCTYPSTTVCTHPPKPLSAIAAFLDQYYIVIGDLGSSTPFDIDNITPLSGGGSEEADGFYMAPEVLNRQFVHTDHLHAMKRELACLHRADAEDVRAWAKGQVQSSSSFSSSPAITSTSSCYKQHQYHPQGQQQMMLNQGDQRTPIGKRASRRGRPGRSERDGSNSPSSSSSASSSVSSSSSLLMSPAAPQGLRRSTRQQLKTQEQGRDGSGCNDGGIGHNEKVYTHESADDSSDDGDVGVYKHSDNNNKVGNSRKGHHDNENKMIIEVSNAAIASLLSASSRWIGNHCDSQLYNSNFHRSQTNNINSSSNGDNGNDDKPNTQSQQRESGHLHQSSRMDDGEDDVTNTHPSSSSSYSSSSLSSSSFASLASPPAELSTPRFGPTNNTNTNMNNDGNNINNNSNSVFANVMRVGQGPWSDVFSIGLTLLTIITNRTPSLLTRSFRYLQSSERTWDTHPLVLNNTVIKNNYQPNWDSAIVLECPQCSEAVCGGTVARIMNADNQCTHPHHQHLHNHASNTTSTSPPSSLSSLVPSSSTGDGNGDNSMIKSPFSVLSNSPSTSTFPNSQLFTNIDITYNSTNLNPNPMTTNSSPDTTLIDVQPIFCPSIPFADVIRHLLPFSRISGIPSHGHGDLQTLSERDKQDSINNNTQTPHHVTPHIWRLGGRDKGKETEGRAPCSSSSSSSSTYVTSTPVARTPATVSSIVEQECITQLATPSRSRVYDYVAPPSTIKKRHLNFSNMIGASGGYGRNRSISFTGSDVISTTITTTTTNPGTSSNTTVTSNNNKPIASLASTPFGRESRSRTASFTSTLNTNTYGNTPFVSNNIPPMSIPGNPISTTIVDNASSGGLSNQENTTEGFGISEALHDVLQLLLEPMLIHRPSATALALMCRSRAME